MSNDSDNFWLGIAVGAAAAILVLAMPATGILESRVTGLRGEAVKRNHAEWVVDPETGETTFAWKPLPGDPISPREIEARSK